MPTLSPRDTLSYPIAAAVWSVASGAVVMLATSARMAWRYAGQDFGLEWALEEIGRQLSYGVLGLSIAAVVVAVVAHARQGRRPDRVGHAPHAALVTGLAATFAATVGGWTGSLVMAYVPLLQSPTGFAVFGVVSSVVHVVAVGVGTMLGAALLLRDGSPAPPASARRRGTVGIGVFFAVLACGVELLATVAASLLDGHGGLTEMPWSALSALVVAVPTAAGYAWMRLGARAERAAWTGDAWAAIAAVPLALVLATVVAVGAGIAIYSLRHGELSVMVVPIALLLALAAFGLFGVATGALRMRRIPTHAA